MLNGCLWSVSCFATNSFVCGTTDAGCYKLPRFTESTSYIQMSRMMISSQRELVKAGCDMFVLFCTEMWRDDEEDYCSYRSFLIHSKDDDTESIYVWRPLLKSSMWSRFYDILEKEDFQSYETETVLIKTLLMDRIFIHLTEFERFRAGHGNSFTEFPIERIVEDSTSDELVAILFHKENKYWFRDMSMIHILLRVVLEKKINEILETKQSFALPDFGKNPDCAYFSFSPVPAPVEDSHYNTSTTTKAVNIYVPSSFSTEQSASSDCNKAIKILKYLDTPSKFNRMCETMVGLMVMSQEKPVRVLLYSLNRNRFELELMNNKFISKTKICMMDDVIESYEVCKKLGVDITLYFSEYMYESWAKKDDWTDGLKKFLYNSRDNCVYITAPMFHPDTWSRIQRALTETYSKH